jgi:hypothetical protein
MSLCVGALGLFRGDRNGQSNIARVSGSTMCAFLHQLRKPLFLTNEALAKDPRKPGSPSLCGACRGIYSTPQAATFGSA